MSEEKSVTGLTVLDLNEHSSIVVLYVMITKKTVILKLVTAIRKFVAVMVALVALKDLVLFSFKCEMLFSCKSNILNL